MEDKNIVLIGQFIHSLKMLGYQEDSIYNFVTELLRSMKTCSEEEAKQLYKKYVLQTRFI